MAKNSNKQLGFTLIELSIVIVIIGLIVSGVVAGQSLVKQSKIRSQITQLENYRTAYNTFKLKYSAIPGDFSKASEYWPGTPNGDGNRKINHDCDSVLNIAQEGFRFFQHLSEAKLVPNDFSNVQQLSIGYPELKISSNMGMVAVTL